ncbi:MAG: PH domain-containing protein [Opitutaceae bacterium]|nr:PH domain-containing protein [Opitutaceae bacterium]
MNESADAAIMRLERPHANLMIYYALACLVFPPAFPFLILPAWFRYHTMRYRFDAEGVSMSWGILFRREIIINYARIQDIHLRSNFVERWLGLARILVQTASGNAGAEMSIEGICEFEAVRDFLYARMRGVKDHESGHAHPATPAQDKLAAVLREIAAEVRALREALPTERDTGPHV